MKKTASVLLSVFIVMQLLVPIYATAENPNPTITVESVADMAGATVNVEVTIENNPGILGATLEFAYDDGLTLVGATTGDAFSALTMTKPGRFTSPCKFTWDGQDLEPTDIKDGTILTLQFTIDPNATAGAEYNISLSYDSGDIVDSGLNPVTVELANGTVSVYDYLPGDLNGDEKVNTTDIIMLRRHIAGGYEQSPNELAGDVDANSKHNATDVILIRRYIAGGYDVALLPGKIAKPQCNHEMTAFPYKAPTCTEEGNIAYWHCAVCECNFSDAQGTTEISENDASIAATGHTVVIDPAVEPTYDSTGLTEGKHCSVCGEVIVPQTVIPVLEREQYAITYYIDNNDTYLQSLAIENPNPAAYSVQDGLVLHDLLVDGYNFWGWYTAQTGGTQVTEISQGSTGNKVLYAHWEKVQYTVQFACDMKQRDIEINTMNYTTGQELALPTPAIDKYTFIGWSDRKTSKIWSTIPAGTTGNIVLYANWVSDRNKAVAVTTLDDPIICEDTENGVILFAYETGEIQYVPLYVTLELECVNGIVTETTVSNQEEISEDNAKEVAETIANATTNSTSWSLSNDWNTTTETTSEISQKTGETTEQFERRKNSSIFTANPSSEVGGSRGSINTNSGSFNYSENKAHRTDWGIDTEINHELTTDDKVSSKLSAEIGAGWGPVSAKVGSEVSAETSQNEFYGEKINTTNSGTDTWDNHLDTNQSYSNSSTDSKTWNTTTGFSNSNSVSAENGVSHVLLNEIAETKGYGKSIAEGGSRSENAAIIACDTKGKERRATVAYHTANIETKTRAFRSTGYTYGNYRMVQAGTMHVFAVVGYNVANRSYFTYTYNVLDDDNSEYLDYSFDGTFNDYESSMIPFEVPYFVNDYVNNRIAKTDGLVFNADTGIITEYKPTGEQPDNVVVIPSYWSVDNHDGTYTSLKVNGISENLFKNNTNLTAVMLGKFITEIPASAFEGCTNLQYVVSPSVTSIGSNAFKGCTSLQPFKLSKDITVLGENAFEGVPQIKAVAANAEIAQTVAASDADSITLDISSIPQEESSDMEFNIGAISSFELQGQNKEYKGLSIKSDAATTIINGVTFSENTKIPMELSSENVTLDRVTADCTGLILALKAEQTNLLLNRTVNLRTINDNAVLCKNITLGSLSTDIVGKLNISGNLLICGEIIGSDYMTVTEGEILSINAEDFENYLSTHRIIFDANGGTVATDSKLVTMNTPIGELPTPSRDYYQFVGWFTEADGGEEVTADTLMLSLTDYTVYAHWLQNEAVWAMAPAPEDATVESRKWTYTQTSYTESTSTSLSGWNRYDAYWIHSSSGSFDYAHFPSGFSTGNWFYQNFAKDQVYAYENETNKRNVSTQHKAYIYWHWCRGRNISDGPYDSWIESSSTSNNRGNFHTFHAFDSTINYDDMDSYGVGHTAVRADVCKDSYYWYQLPYYVCYYDDYYRMFKYSKNEDKESTTYPDEENVSNIQEWVQCRAK